MRRVFAVLFLVGVVGAAGCADASNEGGLSAEEIAAYEACHDACVEGGGDPIECREECSP